MSDFILDFWNNQAEEFGTDAGASWNDSFAIDLEVSFLEGIIKPDSSKILDVGCANGHATFRLAKATEGSVTGIDFAPAMIEMANRQKMAEANPERFDFQVGDVRDLKFEDNVFDFVYTTRVLINLPNWSEQITGIEECLRVCKPGGTVVLLEGFWEPLCRLNAIRQIFGLEPLVEHDFNRYLKEGRLAKLIEEKGWASEWSDYMSFYYLGTRLLRDLLDDQQNYTDYQNEFNREFHRLEKMFSGGNVGIQKAVIIRK